MDKRLDQEGRGNGLEPWWALARASAPVPTPSLMARVWEDAVAHQPAPKPVVVPGRLVALRGAWWRPWQAVRGWVVACGEGCARALRGGVLAGSLASALGAIWWVDAQSHATQDEALSVLEVELWEAEVVAAWAAAS